MCALCDAYQQSKGTEKIGFDIFYSVIFAGVAVFLISISSASIMNTIQSQSSDTNIFKLAATYIVCSILLLAGAGFAIACIFCIRDVIRGIIIGRDGFDNDDDDDDEIDR